MTCWLSHNLLAITCLLLLCLGSLGKKLSCNYKLVNVFFFFQTKFLTSIFQVLNIFSWICILWCKTLSHYEFLYVLCIPKGHRWWKDLLPWGSIAFRDYKINLSLNLFKEFLPSNEQYKLLIFSCSWGHSQP